MPQLKRLRKQKGERVETATAFFLRHYYTAEDGTRKQKQVKIADKSDLYRSWDDCEPLIERLWNRSTRALNS
jgi:hypothetical protein